MREALRGWVRLGLAVPTSLLGLLLIAPLLVAMAPLALVNTLVRLAARLLRPTTVSWTDLVEFDAELGWRTRPNQDAYASDLAGDAFHLTTDENGWRGRRTLEESRVVVFGDSFALGFAVDAKEFFADLPGEPAIKAIGAPAYSIVQPVMLIERLSPRLESKLVVLLVYLGNDLHDSLQPGGGRYRAPFARYAAHEGTWEIFSDHVSPEPWSLSSEKLSYEALIEISSPTYHSRRVFDACAFLVRRARDVCSQAGADLVVMTVPELSPVVQVRIAEVLARGDAEAGYDPDLPDRELRKICEELHVGFVPLAETLTPADYMERDVHWNPSGHRKVASVLRGLARDHADGSRFGRQVVERAKTMSSEPDHAASRRTG